MLRPDKDRLNLNLVPAVWFKLCTCLGGSFWLNDADLCILIIDFHSLLREFIAKFREGKGKNVYMIKDNTVYFSFLFVIVCWVSPCLQPVPLFLKVQHQNKGLIMVTCRILLDEIWLEILVNASFSYIK